MDLIRKNIVLIALLLVVVTAIVVVFRFENKSVVDFSSQRTSQCNVSVLAIDGYLDTSNNEDGLRSLDVAQELRTIAQDDNAALVLLIDSRGGTAVAAEEIIDALHGIERPIVTFVRGDALSAAYWIAVNTDHIIAQRSSLVGSVGVTLSYLDEAQLNDKEGYTFNEIVSGEFKEVGSIEKPLSITDRDYLQSLVDQVYYIFRDDVMTARELSEEDFESLKDAQAFLGESALEYRLIDGVGGLLEVKQALADTLEPESQAVVLCEPNQIQ